MPSTSLQERIKAFENLATSTHGQNGTHHSPDHSVSILEEPISPQANSFSTIVPFTPPHSTPGSPSPSPPNLGRKSSLIDLKDWIVDDGPPPHTPRQHGKHTNGRPMMNNGSTRKSKVWNGQTASNSSAPLINFESPPKAKSAKAPPLPPRKPSYNSLRTTNKNALRPPVRSDSLTVEQHTYPPLSDGSRKGPGHAPASSVSSFHSVSLSSDGGTIDSEGQGDQLHIATFPMDRHNSGESGDTNSLDESFENVSAVSPTTAATLAFDWGEAMNKARQLGPPKLPQRPASKSPSSVSPAAAPIPPPRSVPTSPKLTARSTSSSSSSATTTTRRVPPPPPPSLTHPPPVRFTPRSSRASLASTSASDRSSILSNATTTSRTSTSTRASTQTTSKLSRPTPVPASARKRYEAVFVGNIIQRRKAEKVAAKKKEAMLAPPGTRKSRAAAGWRGLSVDLITNPDEHPTLSGKEKEEEEEIEADMEVGPDEIMDAFSVKLIWGTSKLEKGKLKAIWSECDATKRGSLDRDAFVKGMWRIDEELRRAQFTRQTSRIRPPPAIKHSNPRLILR